MQNVSPKDHQQKDAQQSEWPQEVERYVYWRSPDRRHVILNCDCLEILPTLPKVDAVVTDPPYEIIGGGNTHNTLRGIFDRSQYDNKGKLFAVPDIADWLPQLAAILVNADVFIMANDKWLRTLLNAADENGLRFHNLLVWEKGNVTPNRWFMKSCEFIAYFWAGRARNINDMGSRQLLSVPNNVGNKFHPTEKPPELMEHLIRQSTDDGATILDPFMGSGTTGLVAIQHGRHYIGIELNREYCDMAVKRMERELRQPHLPGLEPHKAVQGTMFGEVADDEPLLPPVPPAD